MKIPKTNGNIIMKINGRLGDAIIALACKDCIRKNLSGIVEQNILEKTLSFMIYIMLLLVRTVFNTNQYQSS